MISYPCDHCEYTSPRVSDLKQHKRVNHERIRFPCDQCEYDTTTPANLKQHIKSKHEGIRYPCDQCKYTATRSSDLNRHKQSLHEGIRYLCDQCDYTAAQYTRLISHKKAKHSQETVVDFVKQKTGASVFIETSRLNAADTEIKEEDMTDEVPVSCTINLREHDPLEDYESSVKKIEDIKEELE